MKLISNVVFVVAIVLVFLALIAAFIIILVLLNQKMIIDDSTVNIADLLVKSSFTLIGSTLSGFVAFLIFFLQDRKQKRDKVEKEKLQLKKIEDEFDNNLAILNTILEIFEKRTTDELTKVLVEPNNHIKETLQIYSIKLDYTFYEKAKDEINEKVFIDRINSWRKTFQVGKYIEALCKTLTNQENIKLILDLIKREIISIRSDEKERRKLVS